MTNPKDSLSTPKAASVNAEEVAHFSALAASWWDPNGPFKPLHKLNPTRIAFARDRLCRHFDRDPKAPVPLKGLKILDIGCGGGLLSEPMARLGATVTGADAAEKNIKTARAHARDMALDIDYRNTTAEQLAAAGEKFDAILNMEVIEHVADISSFLAACHQLLKDDGCMILSTLNRTAKSWAMAIAGAEYLLRWLPRGTHDWRKFLKPSELVRALGQAQFDATALAGMVYHPLSGRWTLDRRDFSVNYLLVAEKVAEKKKPMDKPTRTCRPRIWRPDKSRVETRRIATEIPIALEYNCISHAVMMISPADIEDFAIGFSLTEGVIDRRDDIIDLTLTSAATGQIAAFEITPACFRRLDRFRRTLAGRTGCGLCGIDRLDHAIRPLKPVKSQLKIKAEVVYHSMNRLAALQVHNKKTGALHAAAFVNGAGEILAVREDIGRHNALDKLIGHMMRQGMEPSTGFALITSRCSFEMVHKCATFGIPLLAAISATTDLALRLAEDSGLSLIAFARRDGMNIYCDPNGRLV